MNEQIKTTVQALTIGRYRHYKGGEYDVVAVATHSETGESLVVYRCLSDEGSWWVRPLSMFTENVAVDGKELPRFALLYETGET